MNWRVWLFLIAVFSTFFCTAVNCYTWRLAYPLWRQTGPACFARLHGEYLRLLGPVITFPHIVMFFASGLLLLRRPLFFSASQAVALFLLDGGVVALSASLAGPIHTRFTRSGILDESGLHRLLVISAVRSVLMLAASGILCSTLAQSLPG